ncbi:hypothetical protein RIVM261_074930 [Rivularia sp. IAM M-261]|nr:hypothetical protein CAL7716_039330 [Calothrix sp. PCC 7716]GJD22537.1 hypothetical protein RIVM261_074930 [Rivularia sp. IAM M-261]
MKLMCPVCQRPDIENNICPNCETDLSLIRMLTELPQQRKNTSIWLLVIVAIFCLILGFILAALI